MSFTRSTEDLRVHQSLSDYPNSEDGLTASELKELFDSPAIQVQSDMNNLEDELEASTSASNIGAAQLFQSDTSNSNVQAKLERLYQEILAVAQTGIADGTITQTKLDPTYEQTLAKKNNVLQLGLNAEMLGGYTLANLFTYIYDRIVSGTYTGNNSIQEVVLGFTPRIVLISGYLKNPSYNISYDNNAIAILLGTKGKIITSISAMIGADITVDLTDDGFKLLNGDMNSSNKTYSYIAFR